jgi:hypothetical protein
MAAEWRKTADTNFTVWGWWVRLIWGSTFKPKRFRWHRFHEYRLLAVRLWGEPSDGRLVGIQWRRARD